MRYKITTIYNDGTTVLDEVATEAEAVAQLAACNRGATPPAPDALLFWVWDSNISTWFVQQSY